MVPMTGRESHPVNVARPLSEQRCQVPALSRMSSKPQRGQVLRDQRRNGDLGRIDHTERGAQSEADRC